MLERNSDQFQPANSFNQDRDLYARLNQYMDTVELSLKQGRGWFIFNADRTRAARISTLLLERLAGYRPFVSYFHVPWRDFSLNAYMKEVELSDEERNQAQAANDQHLKKELNIARRVTTDTSWAMLVSDLVIISGLAPKHDHEARRLAQVMEGRFNRQMATVLITPQMPHELAEDFDQLAPETDFWGNLYGRMYKTGFMAL
ncbi:MAG: hypothetical protein WCS37_13000 [Chloroflexota bacterium]|nr:hypothetical protein [Chloroflexota bacterium]